MFTEIKVYNINGFVMGDHIYLFFVPENKTTQYLLLKNDGESLLYAMDAFNSQYKQIFYNYN